MKVCKWAESVDKVIFRFMYFVSILAAVALTACALLCTVDSLSAKIFSVSVPNGTDWVTYLNIPIVFLAMGYLQVERGNTVVDLVSNKFPKFLNLFFQVFGNLLGSAVSGYLAYCALMQTIAKFSSHTKSSSAGNAFYVWPFALVIAVGYLLVAISFFWCVFRIFLIAPERRQGAFVMPGGEMNGDAVDGNKATEAVGKEKITEIDGKEENK